MADDKIASIERAVDDLKPEIIGFLQELVRVPSVTGREEAAQQLMARAMREMGLEVDVWEPDLEEMRPYFGVVGDHTDFAGRPNVVGVLRGSGGGRSLILNGHIDTVPPGEEGRWTRPPFSGEVVDGKLYGRGACDMKGGLAAILFALRALARAGIAPRGDVIVESVIGEENGGVGAVASLTRGYKADAAIIAEPTSLAIVPAIGGAAVFRMHLAGRAAHASVREQGVSAVEKFCYMLAGLEEFERRRNAILKHPLYERIANKIPVSIGVVRAGDWPAMVPEWLVAEGRVGLFPGETLEGVHAEFERHVKEWASVDPWLREHPPRVEWFGGQFAPAEIPLSSPLVRLMQESFRQATGQELVMSGATYGSDMRHFMGMGNIPTLHFGPGDVRNAHFTDEFVPLEEVIAATKTLAAAASEW